MAVDAAGTVYVADGAASRVTRALAPNGPPAELRFATGAGAASFSNDEFGMRLLTPSSGSVILEESRDLVTWQPVRTNTLSLPTLDLSLPVSAAQDAFFRLKPGP